jgi:hypothetical protein
MNYTPVVSINGRKYVEREHDITKIISKYIKENFEKPP